MLNTGSCGLHIIHGAFMHGVEPSGWNVDEFLKSVHWCLKDTPARRDDYAKAVNNENPLMPLRFCKTHWTENVNKKALIRMMAKSNSKECYL